jgi:hypothetical protein
VGKSLGKCPLERLRMKWEDNIEMRLRETGFKYQSCRGLAQSVRKCSVWDKLVSYWK